MLTTWGVRANSVHCTPRSWTFARQLVAGDPHAGKIGSTGGGFGRGGGEVRGVIGVARTPGVVRWSHWPTSGVAAKSPRIRMGRIIARRSGGDRSPPESCDAI